MQRSLFDVVAPAAAERPNRIIEAGAGTGKTTRIVRDALDLLLTRPDLDPSRIVLMTFTEKAAGEISVRLRAALIEVKELLEAGQRFWPSERSPILEISQPRMAEARAAATAHAANLDSIRSQTIHSFCQTVLRRYALEARIDPDFRILEDLEKRILFASVFDRWAEEELTDASEERTLEWKDALRTNAWLEPLQKALTALHPRREILEDDRLSLGTLDELADWLGDHFGVIAARGSEHLRARPNEALASLVDFASGWAPPRGREEWDDFVSRLEEMRSVNASKSLGGAQEPWKAIKDLKSDFLMQHRAAVAQRALATRFFEAVDEEKRRRGVVDFDDLLDLTDRVLRDPVVLAEVRRDYDAFFVDEFQDTDRVQARIVERLARDESGKLPPGRLTIVGDPKQSIYSFRRAEPEIFHRLLTQFSSEGAVVETLDVQYRSDPPLVDAINALFSVILPQRQRLGPVVQPEYVSLHAGRSEATRDLEARLRFIAVEVSDGDAALEAQAEAVADWIARNRDRRDASGEHDLRRFAILLRKLTNAEVWADVFARRGIALLMPPATDLLTQRGSTDVIAVLAAIADPMDKAARFSAARSLVFGIDDAEIVMNWDSPQTARYEAFRSSLDRWRREALRGGISGILDRIVDERRLETTFTLLADGAILSARLERLRNLAAGFDAAGGGSMRAFLSELARLREAESEKDLHDVDEDANAVRLMTIHSAKGLEFDTVILPDLASGIQRGGTDAFAVEEAGALVLTSPSSINGMITSVQGSTLGRLQAQRSEWERDRLFYVAVTRARTDVVFVTTLRDGAAVDRQSEFWKTMAPAFGIPAEVASRFPELIGSTIVELEIGERTIPVAFERAAVVKGEVEPPRLIPPLTADRLASHPVTPVHSDEETRTPRWELTMRRAGSRKRRHGIAVHRALELWEEGMPLDDLAGRVRHEMNLTDPELRSLRGALSRLERSTTWSRVRGGNVVGRELAIMYRDSDGRLRTGRIDLLIRDGAGVLVVVDYKTGESSAERITNDSEQIAGYCRRISAMRGEPCLGVLWYLDEDRSVDVTPVPSTAG